MPIPRWSFVATTLCLAMIAACSHRLHEAQKQEPQKSAREVVEQFSKMEVEGRWLGPQYQDELANFLTDAGQPAPPEAVYVLKGYKVGNESKRVHEQVSYSVEVDYDEWGEIDSFLNFNPHEGEKRTYETLYLSNGGWRISLFPFNLPRVNVDAAMQWVVQMRDKSDSPAIKYNAENTLAILKSLSAGEPAPTNPARIAKERAAKVAARFIQLEKNLLPGQWSQLSGFFVETPKPKWDRVHVVDIVDVGTDVESHEDASVTEAEVATNSLGDLDASLRLHDYPSMRLPLTAPSASACFGDDRFGFSLLLTEKHWEIGKDVRELDGPPAWRIEDTAFQPLITLDTAIRYVKQASEKTTDPIAKRNAATTLRILNAYKQGRPLPGELSSEATGGCG